MIKKKNNPQKEGRREEGMVHSLIHPYLENTYYLPGAELGMGVIAVNKQTKCLPEGAQILIGRQTITRIPNNKCVFS